MERLWEGLKEHFKRLDLAIGLLVLIAISMGAAFFFLAEPGEVAPVEEMIIASIQAEEQKETASLEEEEKAAFEVSWKADIKGAVAFPGVYEVEPGMRIQDLVDKAGGVRPDAEVRHLNLAQLLEDQIMVYVPTREEATATAQETTADFSGLVQMPGDKAEKVGLIDLNTADAAELQQLNGIGEKKAELILLYRQEHGPFQTIEELMNVKGIGEKTFDSLADQITVSPQR